MPKATRQSMRNRFTRAISVFAFFLSAATAARSADAIASHHPPVIQGAVKGVATDAEGNVYVVGQFSETKDFNPAKGLAEKTSNGETDVFVTRYNADGTYAWTSTAGGPNRDYGAAIAVSGRTVFATGGWCRGRTGEEAYDCFVWAIDSVTGAALTSFGHQGLLYFGGMGDDRGRSIAVSGKTLYVAGYFASSDARLGQHGPVTNHGEEDVFVLGFDASTGTPLDGFGDHGIQTFGGAGGEYAESLALNEKALFVAGRFKDRLAVGSGSQPPPSVGTGSGAFLVALSPKDGKPLETFGTNGMEMYGQPFDAGYGAFADEKGLFLAGRIRGDAAVLSLDPITGKVRNAFGNHGVQALKCSTGGEANSVMADEKTVYVLGSFGGDGVGIGRQGSISAKGRDDIFLMALDRETGAARTAFNQMGLLTIGGSSFDFASGLARFQNKLYVAGFICGTDVHVGSIGPIKAESFQGLLLGVSTEDGATLLENTSERK